MKSINDLKNIKNSLIRLTHYEKLADQKEEAYEAEPENIDREAAFAAAYELEFNEYVHAAHLISRFAGIEEKMARSLVTVKRNDILAVIDSALQ